MHHRFRVTTKAIIFNHDGSKILVVHKEHNDHYGLPGGHVDEDESLESAMRRELFEECGVHATALRKVDFFLLDNGKIVLLYIGTIDTDDVISQQNNVEGIPKWLTRDEFNAIDIDKNYRDLVFDYWLRTNIHA